MAHRRRNAVVAAATGGALTAAVLRSSRPRWSQAEDPCGPDGLRLPDGEEHVIETDDGASLHVLVAGPEDGPMVVLPHCWMGAMVIWSAVARRLVADGHRVVLYDQRGHGRSTLGERVLSTDGLGHDLDLVLRTLDVHDAVLAGHSMGGMTIQALAKTHPATLRERCRGVALVSTSAYTSPVRLPAGVANALFSDKRTAAMTKRGAWRVRSSVGRDVHRAHLQATLDALVGTQAAARAGFMVAMTRMDYRGALASIGVPTVVLVGTRDRLTPPARARTLATRIPNARLIVLPGLGHMLPLEAPDAVAHAIAGLAAPKAAATA